MTDTKQLAIRIMSAILDRTELYDDEGLLNTTIDKPGVGWVPDLTETGAAAMIVDALIAAGLLVGDRDNANRDVIARAIGDPNLEKTQRAADRVMQVLARSSSTDTPKDLDPLPWLSPMGNRRSEWFSDPDGILDTEFDPRTRYEQDESKYPRSSGVAETPLTDEQIAEDNADWHREIPEDEHPRLTHAELLISEVETAVNDGTFGQTAWWRRRAIGLAKELKGRLVEGVADTVKKEHKRFTATGDPIMGDVDYGGFPDAR